MPARIGGAEVVDLARLGPGLADPVFLLDVADEVQHPAGRDEIVDEVPARAEKGRRLRRNVAHLLRGNQPAIGAAGEPRTLRSDAARGAPPKRCRRRRSAHRPRSRRRSRTVTRTVLPSCSTPTQRCARCTRSGGTALASSACSSPRWKIMCGAPNSFSMSVAERRLGQRAAVVPAALMEERRAERHLGAFLAKPEPDQDARRVRADVDAGADLAEQARLLVDLHVEAGLQQADRGGEPADAAADDGDPDVLGRHHATRLPRTWS